MSTVAHLLATRGRAEAQSRAAGWARRTHLLVLVAAVLLAVATRWLVPVPGVQGLVGAPLAVALAVLALVLLAWLLKAVAVPWLAPSPRRLARRLDGSPGWRDRAATALDVEEGRAPGALGPILVGEVAAHLAAQPLPATAAVSRGRPWLRGALLVLFVLVLLVPGVDGRLGLRGAGHGGEVGLGWREEVEPGPMDADLWLEKHARFVLAHTDDPPGSRVTLTLATDLPLPAALRGDLTLRIDDDAHEVPLGALALSAGEPARHAVTFDVAALPGLAERLAPGTHEARARLQPTADPFRRALRSNVLEIEVRPPEQGGGGGGGTPPPQPKPEPPPPQPPPPPPSGEGEEPPTPQPQGGRDEVVTPFVNPGETVKKERAVVAARAPDAGLEPPTQRPLAEALREFDRVVEGAVGRERLGPAERELVRRYFATLRRLTEPGAR